MLRYNMFSSKTLWLRGFDRYHTLFMQRKNVFASVSYGTLSLLPEFGKRQLCVSSLPSGLGSNRKLLGCSTFGRAFHTEIIKRLCFSDGTDQNNKHSESGIANNTNTSNLLETWFYEVSPYGSLTAQLPFNTTIRPLNPQNYPDMNKCIIELYYNVTGEESGAETKIPNAHQLAQITDLYSLNVSFDKDRANMNLSCDVIEGLNPPISCCLRVPLKFDLSVKMDGGENVSVEGMEGDCINIETNKGNVYLKKNKSGSVSVMSKAGNIVSEFTQLGNINMNCGNAGSITADKLQGSNVTCVTELGSLNVKSLYTESATFKTVTGDVHLGHCHGQVYVVGERSDVQIESLDGDLDIALHQGSVNVHLSRHNKVDVDLNTGEIGLSFPEGAKTNLNLSSSSISVAETLLAHFDNSDSSYLKEGYIGAEGVAQVNARTMSGNISLDVLDWIQTTKLAFMVKEE